MTAVTLWCRHCDGENEFPWYDESLKCKHCGTVNYFRTLNDPKVEYDISVNDRRFLRSLRIAPE